MENKTSTTKTFIESDADADRRLDEILDQCEKESNSLQNERLERKREIEYELDGMIIKLEELLHLQSLNYEPYKEKQTKLAIRALLNIRGFVSLKAFHKVDAVETVRSKKCYKCNEELVCMKCGHFASNEVIA